MSLKRMTKKQFCYSCCLFQHDPNTLGISKHGFVVTKSSEFGLVLAAPVVKYSFMEIHHYGRNVSNHNSCKHQSRQRKRSQRFARKIAASQRRLQTWHTHPRPVRSEERRVGKKWER